MRVGESTDSLAADLPSAVRILAVDEVVAVVVLLVAAHVLDHGFCADAPVSVAHLVRLAPAAVDLHVLTASVGQNSVAAFCFCVGAQHGLVRLGHALAAGAIITWFIGVAWLLAAIQLSRRSALRVSDGDLRAAETVARGREVGEHATVVVDARLVVGAAAAFFYPAGLAA